MSAQPTTPEVAETAHGRELAGRHCSPFSSLAESVTSNPPDTREAGLLLEALRWKEDMQIVNDFDEHVWLKPLFVNEKYETVSPETPGARRIGITDCCLVSDPCERHRNMANVPHHLPRKAGGFDADTKGAA